MRVRLAEPTDREAVMDVLVLAFATDPVLRWMLPSAGDYLRGHRRILEQSTAVSLERGGVGPFLPGRAASLWFAPGTGLDPKVMGPILASLIPEEEIADKFGFLREMGAHHPAEPHWYLPVIGVDPAHQGRGLGSALLARALERVDAEGLPAYLESSAARNVPLYQRFGFEVTSEIQHADSPTAWAMLRPAR